MKLSYRLLINHNFFSPVSFILFFAIPTLAQSNIHDSLVNNIKTTSSIRARLEAIRVLSLYYRSDLNYESADSLFHLGVRVAEETNDKKAIFWSHLNYYYRDNAFPPKAYTPGIEQKLIKALK